MIFIELIPILLGIMFVVNILEEYKQFGVIVEKLNEGEKNENSKATLNEREVALNERELALNKREAALNEKEAKFIIPIAAAACSNEALPENTICVNKVVTKKKISINNSLDVQYAKKLKTRFR
jgi:hypothetical protein